MRVVRFRRVSTLAHIYLADAFASGTEVDGILQAAELEAAGPGAETTVKRDRTGFSFELPVAGHRPLEAFAARLHGALGFRNRQDATMRFRRYGPGEAHPAHVDAFTIGDDDLVATAMLWLEQPRAGGETIFPAAGAAAADGVRLVPQRGQLALWLNYTAAGEVDLAAAHEGLPVIEGTKTTITSFVYAPRATRPAFALAPDFACSRA